MHLARTQITASSLLIGVIVSVALVVVARGMPASQTTSTATDSVADSVAIENSGVAVEVDGRPILRIYAPVAGISPQERAEAIEARIVSLAKGKTVAVEDIHADNRGTWTEIIAGNNRIMGITEADAAAAEMSRAELANEYREIIRQVIKQYREEHTLRHLVAGIARVLGTTCIFVGVLVGLFRMRRAVRRRLQDSLTRELTGPLRLFGRNLAHYLGQPLLLFGRAVFWIAVLIAFQAYVSVALRFFPSTKYLSYQLTSWVLSQFGSFGKLILDDIPNLFLLAVICFIAACLIKINHFVFGEIRDGRLTISGFYPDWGEPTAKLVRTLILVAAIIIAFPYMPGSNSPAFKGISVFLGVLLSLGSTSAVAHAIAGTILTYMRAFQIGDFVRIGSDLGEVLEKTLLVTRMRTQKNEVITIPNGTVLGGVVMNYSAEGRKRGVIFHTVVSIGYSAPWRHVHSLLISAALETEDVLHDPSPFVLQTALNDFYVSYELNAYTGKPMNMMNIYSTMHQNIQDKFNQAGVEINSPHYLSLRDGNETTIPHDYVPKDYKHPVFEFQQSDDRGSTPVSSVKVGTIKGSE